MDISGLMVEAAQLMVVGMLVVFAFLGILIQVTSTLAKYAGEEPAPHVPMKRAATTAQPQNTIPPETVAAISAAIHQHRQLK